MIGKLTLTCVTAAMVYGVSSDSRDVATKTIRYEIDGATFESTIVHHGKPDSNQPGILMVPNWMGPTDGSLAKAKSMAGDGYLVMMVDMYGVDTRPSNAGEASQAAGAVRADRALMRRRALEALAVFRAEGPALGLDPKRVAAAGFCFGGGTVLELGRAGADVDVVASFHGDLKSPTLAKDAEKTRARVLVLHGADDPYVPQEDVGKFVEVMAGTDVDWQLVQFGGTVHSFTNPAAASDGARYHERSAKRAFQAFGNLLDETWSD